MIWFNPLLRIEELLPLGKDSMGEWLGLEWEELGPDYLRASMPVDHRTKQPYGLLHGGASCVLAETLGSVGSALLVDPSRFYCVGLEINANHIKSVTKGRVIGKASPLHIGAKTHVWDIRIHDEREKLICVSRLTVAVLNR
jgi:1,4-dihydroxy-2-naphthoyl-CoA hydrolase